MSWFSNIIAQMLAASSPAAATAPAAASATTAAPVAPAAGAEQRRIQWAPDNSTYVDLNQYPNALWRDANPGGGSEGAPGSAAGFYTPDSYDGGDVHHGELIRPFQSVQGFGGDMQYDAMPSYAQLKSEGQWDLSSLDSPIWGYLSSKGGGDATQDVGALYRGLLNSGVDGGLWRGDMGSGTIEGAQFNRPYFENDMRAALADLPPELRDLLVPAFGQAHQDYQANIDDSTTLRDVINVGREMIALPPVTAALTAMGGGPLASMLGGGVAGTVGAGAAFGAAGAYNAGGNIGKGAIQGGLSAYGGSELPGADVADAGSAVPFSSTPGSTTFDVNGVPTSSTPAMTRFSAGAGTPPVFSGQTGAFTPGMLGDFNTLDLDKQDALNRAALEAGDNPAPADSVPATKSPIPSIDPRTLAKVANAVIGMVGEAKDAPQRQQGQNDADYSKDLAQYLSLDADAMAQLGLTPGTQEYYDYIMQQADQVIQQIAGDVDVNGDDLAAQFRGKTQAELEQLQRALYVRGQLDLLTGSGQHTDPFTGVSQDVVAPGTGMFNPSVGAFERGKAGDVNTLRGMGGQEGFDYLQQLLGRKSDLFGMDRAAQDRFEQAKLEDDMRRRRGMLSY